MTPSGEIHAATPDSDPDRQRISQEIQDGLTQIAAFTGSDPFQALLDEMWSCPPEARHQFVLDVVLDPNQLRRRNIDVPADMKIMRSAFRDNRPTLFCVVRYVPDGLGWSKVTVTFDNPSGPPALRYADIADVFGQEAALGVHA